MTHPSETYVFVATAAESLALSTSEVMDMVDSGRLNHTTVGGIVLIESSSLAAVSAALEVA